MYYILQTHIVTPGTRQGGRNNLNRELKIVDLVWSIHWGLSFQMFPLSLLPWHSSLRLGLWFPPNNTILLTGVTRTVTLSPAIHSSPGYKRFLSYWCRTVIIMKPELPSLIFAYLSGIPEAVISWGESERIVSNGTSLLNSWEADIYQVFDTDIFCPLYWQSYVVSR